MLHRSIGRAYDGSRQSHRSRLKEKTMSDTILESSAVRAASLRAESARAKAGGKSRWRRAKIRLGGFVDVIGEVLDDIERGRAQHPTVSAYRP
jgi:hypothetical protein